MLRNMLHLLLTFALIANIGARTVNIAVNREIDITTQISKEKTVIVLKNYGENALRNYTFVVSPEMKNYFLEFTNSDNETLHYTEIFAENNVFIVHLNRVVETNETYELIANVFCLEHIQPRNKKRTMSENQILYYRGNVYYYSFYKTFSLKVTYICKPGLVCTASYLPHTTISNKLHYSYSNVIPFSVKEMKISFTNNDSIYAIKSLQRTIDVSHWGRILIEDCVTIKNIGSEITGPYEPTLQFSRPWLHTHLSASVEDVKYFDEIGNNSKSQMIYSDNHTTLKHQARYPLFGGWKAPYTLKYKVPTHEYLHQSNDVFHLRIRAIDHIINDGFIEKATVKILLPEGAVIKKISAPVWFNVSEEIALTEMCFFGRETIVLTGEMLMENHIENLVIIYEFTDIWLFKTPIVIMIYLQVVFIFVIIVNRLKYL